MVLRTLLGDGPRELTDAIPARVDASRLLLAGARDLDPAEQEFIGSQHIRLIEELSTSGRESLLSELRETEVEGVYVHVDVDVFKPESFGDALFSVPGGPRPAEVAATIAAIGEEFEIVGVGVVEYLGGGDDSAARLREFLQAAVLWPPRG